MPETQAVSSDLGDRAVPVLLIARADRHRADQRGAVLRPTSPGAAPVTATLPDRDDGPAAQPSAPAAAPSPPHASPRRAKPPEPRLAAARRRPVDRGLHRGDDGRDRLPLGGRAAAVPQQLRREPLAGAALPASSAVIAGQRHRASDRPDHPRRGPGRAAEDPADRRLRRSSSRARRPATRSPGPGTCARRSCPARPARRSSSAAPRRTAARSATSASSGPATTSTS